jgi:hypothetical protein
MACGLCVLKKGRRAGAGTRLHFPIERGAAFLDKAALSSPRYIVSPPALLAARAPSATTRRRQVVAPARRSLPRVVA